MNQLGSETSRALDITATPAQIQAHVAAVGPSKLLQGLPERRNARLPIRVAIVGVHQSCDATHPIWLLRPRRERPCRRGAAYEGDEVTPSHNLVLHRRITPVYQRREEQIVPHRKPRKRPPRVMSAL